MMQVYLISATDIQEPGASGTGAYVLSLFHNLRSEGVDTKLMAISSIEMEDVISVVRKTKHTYSYLLKLFAKTRGLNIPGDAIIHTQRADFLVPFLLFRKGGTRIITLHGPAIKSIHLRKNIFVYWVYKIMEKYAVNRADGIICVSEENRNFFLERFPHLKDITRVIPIGVDTSIFKPLNKELLRKKYNLNIDDNILLYVGRFSKEKRISSLFHILKKVKETYPDTKLVLVGDGPEKPESGPDILNIGTRAKQEVAELMNCADVLLLCSKFEGLPTVVLEAMACGLPVVSTKVGDVPKLVVDRMTGFTAEKIEKMPKLVKKVLENPARFKNNCVQTADKYSWEGITKKIINMYQKLSERK